MFPKQTSDIPETRAALAPYNFVPLPDKIVRAEEVVPEERVPAITKPDGTTQEFPYLMRQDVYHPDRCTGQITCKLTTASPLYVRCGLTLDQFEQGLEAKELADFFHLLDRSHPVIPGSSLRGMLRALVEIAAYGKMEKVTDRPRYFYRAVAAKMDDPLATPYRAQLRNVRAGYMVRRGREWFIRPARAIGNEPYLKAREQDIPPALGLVRLNDPSYHLQTLPVSFSTKKLRPSPRNPQGRLVIDLIGAPGTHSEEGWLVTSGNMLETGTSWQRSPRKNHAVIGEAGSGELKIADAAVDDYRQGLSDFQIEQLGADGVLQDGRPVFYCEPPRGEREVVYFGHSPNFRLPFRFAGSQRAATPLDFVPAQLRDDMQIDLAEAIFGFVRRTKQAQNQAVAGRVFVGDATLDAGQEAIWYSDEPITPRILATPKPTTFQHYLVQSSVERPALKHYASRPGDETVVRGHKLYWHKGDQPDIGLPEAQQQIKDTQKTQILPVRAGVHFTFDVRFENLNRVELGALLWVLRLAADDDYRLKLGMGKPLGMGAVKIESSVALGNRADRYKDLFAGDNWASGTEAPLSIVELEAQTQCIAAFQKYVVEESGDTSGDGDLRGNLRIRCLLALLRWPGPLPETTRYLEIERDVRQGVIPAAEIKRGEQKVNEYKLRPVLPLPTQITGEPMAASAMQHGAQAAIVERLPEPSRAAGPRIPIEGEIFTGLVLERDEQTVLIEVPGFSHDQALGTLRVEPDTPKWAPGKDRARVQVVGVRQQAQRTVLDLKRGPRAEKK
jgi:CRISPR-associated protein (TIGR03986 family)